MTIKQIKEIAKEKGVTVDKGMKKENIIRAIQRAEGNFECFGTATAGVCNQISCLWMEDCLK
jgi:hypothetical protein